MLLYLRTGLATVLKASEIAKDIKRDKLKRAVLVKEIMVERRVNKILDILRG